jgi:RNase P subunit RPR2
MSWAQRLILHYLPAAWTAEIQRESESWRIRCLHCHHSRSVWEAGGIRWKARSVGKRTLVHCSHCGGLRRAAVERIPTPSSDHEQP